MSDPELAGAAAAVARSPSPASVNASEKAALNYAFLVHSQKTLTQNLPPRVDNKLLARQKRRRTSPEDQAILEAEYQRNPKPDKATRASIVSRVSLGEKEVQIWFQNRRQNDRRKSKPLQPHELLAPRSGAADHSGQGSHDDNGHTELGSSAGVEQPGGHDQGTVNKDCVRKSLDDRSLPSSFASDVLSGDRDEPEQPLPSTQTSLATEFLDNSQRSVHEKIPESGATQNQETILTDDLRSLSAKRKRAVSDVRGNGSDAQPLWRTGGPQEEKSPPSLRLSLSFDGEAMVRKDGELTPSPPKGRNALRIAMSSDGKAVIRAGDEPSPSKNRVSMFSTRTSRFAGLRRSSSAVVLGTPQAGATFGRSRDPRNWESFFDTDARSALSTPACSQTAPSTDSPSLFRSRSQRSLNRSLSGRYSMLAPNADLLDTETPQRTGEKRRKLSRTVSSLGRLESARGRAQVNKESAYPLKESKALTNAKKDLDDLEKHFGDSDKENWIPGTRTSHVRRRTTVHNTRRSVLKDSSGRDGKTNRNLTSNGRRTRAVQGQLHKLSGKDGEAMPELSADVSAFMPGGSQEEDLDCIQGLLSLSQGAWR